MINWNLRYKVNKRCHIYDNDVIDVYYKSIDESPLYPNILHRYLRILQFEYHVHRTFCNSVA